MPLPLYLPHKQHNVNPSGQIYLGRSFIGLNIEVWIDSYKIATVKMETGRAYVGREYAGKRAMLYFLRDEDNTKERKD